MPPLTKENKDEAFKAQEKASRCAGTLGLLGVIAGGGVSLAVPPAGLGVAVACAAFAYAMQDHGIKLGRVVHDPPDESYRTSVRVRSTRIDLALLSDDVVSSAARTPLQSILRASDLLAAMVRAVERAQGAEQAEAGRYMTERIEQAESFGSLAAEQLEIVSGSLPLFIDSLQELFPAGISTETVNRPKWLRDALHDEVLGPLYKMGVPLTGLEVDIGLSMPDVRRQASTQLGEVAKASSRYAELLRRPTTDLAELEAPPRTVPPTGITERLEMRQAVAGREEPPSYREVLLLVWEGLTVRQVSERLGVTTEEAQAILRYTQNRLREDQRRIQSLLDAADGQE